MSTPHIAGINLHPIKSTAIRPVNSAYVAPAGLAGDREWVIIDATGEKVSARELARLFHIVAETPETGGTDEDLLLTAAGMTPLAVGRPTQGSCDVTLFGRAPLPGRPAGSEADAWIRTATDRHDLRLVWCANPAARQLDPSYSRPGDHAAFQDAYPVTVLSTASVARINDWVSQTATEAGEAPPAQITAQRYRPNLLIDGVLEAFAEDTWARIQIGDVVLRRATRVDRCVVTTIDPRDLSRGREPIRTLARHRRAAGKTWAAVHYIPDAPGRVAVGDALTVQIG